jgi:hypothetical protein
VRADKIGEDGQKQQLKPGVYAITLPGERLARRAEPEDEYEEEEAEEAAEGEEEEEEE